MSWVSETKGQPKSGRFPPLRSTSAATALTILAKGADDVDGFLHPPAAGDDIFRHDKACSRFDLKSAAQNQFPFLLLHKNVRLAQGPGDFVTNDNPPESGGGPPARQESQAQPDPPAAPHTRAGDLGVLEQQCTLKELPGVKPAPKLKMPVEQGVGRSKEFQQFSAIHGFGVCEQSSFICSGWGTARRCRRQPHVADCATIIAARR